MKKQKLFILGLILGMLFWMAPAFAVADLKVSDITTTLPGGVSSSSVPLGSEVTFSVPYSNEGPDSTRDASLYFSFGDAPFRFVSSSIVECTSARGGSIVCVLGRLAAGFGRSVDVTVVPSSVGEFQVTARIEGVSERGGELNMRNNESSTSITIVEASPSDDEPRSAALKLSLNAGSNSIAVGESLHYIITIDNGGPDEASAIVVKDTLTPNSRHSDVSARWTANPSDPEEWVSVARDFCAWAADQPLNCLLPFPLPSGGRAEIFFDVTPAVAGTLTNSANVTSGVVDPYTDDNSATLNTRVTPRMPRPVWPPASANLSISMSANPDPVLVNGELTYKLSVKNGGPANARGVMVTDTLPEAVSYLSSTVSIEPSRRENITPCTLEEGGVLTCDIGDLVREAIATVLIVVKPTQVGTFTNTAKVTVVTPDHNQSDNTVSLKITSQAPSPSDEIKPEVQALQPLIAEEQKAPGAVEESKPATAEEPQDDTGFMGIGCSLILRR